MKIKPLIAATIPKKICPATAPLNSPGGDSNNEIVNPVPLAANTGPDPKTRKLLSDLDKNQYRINAIDVSSVPYFAKNSFLVSLNSFLGTVEVSEIRTPDEEKTVNEKKKIVKQRKDNFFIEQFRSLIR